MNDDPEVVTQSGPGLGRIDKIYHGADALFLDPQGRDLHEAGWVDTLHSTTQGRAAPAVDDDRSAGFDLNGFGRQEIRDDLQVPWIADLDERRSSLNHCFVLLDDPEHTAAHGRVDLDTAVLIGASIRYGRFEKPPDATACSRRRTSSWAFAVAS